MNVPVQHSGEKLKIGLPQNFDRTLSPSFREACNGAFDKSNVKEIEIDFGNVHYIDSSALGSLLLLRDRAKATEISISFIRCQPEVMKILSMANFHLLFDIH